MYVCKIHVPKIKSISTHGKFGNNGGSTWPAPARPALVPRGISYCILGFIISSMFTCVVSLWLAFVLSDILPNSYKFSSIRVILLKF